MRPSSAWPKLGSSRELNPNSTPFVQRDSFRAPQPAPRRAVSDPPAYIGWENSDAVIAADDQAMMAKAQSGVDKSFPPSIRETYTDQAGRIKVTQYQKVEKALVGVGEAKKAEDEKVEPAIEHVDAEEVEDENLAVENEIGRAHV